ncbi:hypothetical protein ACXYTP_16135 [Tsukamurella ocularis]|uniref:hypothetical protein n=1 Tax=Tsukamurella ocularis TaxID=1970234 RepID=UPI0039EFF809
MNSERDVQRHDDDAVPLPDYSASRSRFWGLTGVVLSATCVVVFVRVWWVNPHLPAFGVLALAGVVAGVAAALLAMRVAYRLTVNPRDTTVRVHYPLRRVEYSLIGAQLDLVEDAVRRWNVFTSWEVRRGTLTIRTGTRVLVVSAVDVRATMLRRFHREVSAVVEAAGTAPRETAGPERRSVVVAGRSLTAPAGARLSSGWDTAQGLVAGVLALLLIEAADALYLGPQGPLAYPVVAADDYLRNQPALPGAQQRIDPAARVEHENDGCRFTTIEESGMPANSKTAAARRLLWGERSKAHFRPYVEVRVPIASIDVEGILRRVRDVAPRPVLRGNAFKDYYDLGEWRPALHARLRNEEQPILDVHLLMPCMTAADADRVGTDHRDKLSRFASWLAHGPDAGT